MGSAKSTEALTSATIKNIEKQSQSIFLTVPDDILKLVLKYVSKASLCRVRLCCKLLLLKTKELGMLDLRIPTGWALNLPQFLGQWIIEKYSGAFITIEIWRDFTYVYKSELIATESPSYTHAGKLKFTSK